MNMFNRIMILTLYMFAQTAQMALGMEAQQVPPDSSKTVVTTSAISEELSLPRLERDLQQSSARKFLFKSSTMVGKAKKQKEDREIGAAIKKEMETAEKQMKQKELNTKVGAFIGKITGFFSQGDGSTPH